MSFGDTEEGELMSDKDFNIIQQIGWFWLSSRKSHPGINLRRALDGYRALRKSGRSDNEIVIYWSSPVVGMSRADAATFVSAMKEINVGRPIQNPNERPAWKEVIDESGLPGTKNNPFPWFKVTAIGAVALFVVWGLPNLVKATRDSGHKKEAVP